MKPHSPNGACVSAAISGFPGGRPRVSHKDLPESTAGGALLFGLNFAKSQGNAAKCGDPEDRPDLVVPPREIHSAARGR
jgi:hypothetical protein